MQKTKIFADFEEKTGHFQTTEMTDCKQIFTNLKIYFTFDRIVSAALSEAPAFPSTAFSSS